MIWFYCVGMLFFYEKGERVDEDGVVDGVAHDGGDGPHDQEVAAVGGGGGVPVHEGEEPRERLGQHGGVLREHLRRLGGVCEEPALQEVAEVLAPGHRAEHPRVVERLRLAPHRLLHGVHEEQSLLLLRGGRPTFLVSAGFWRRSCMLLLLLLLRYWTLNRRLSHGLEQRRRGRRRGNGVGCIGCCCCCCCC